MTLAPEAGQLRAKLHSMGVVINESTDAEGQVTLQLEIQRKDYQRLFSEQVNLSEEEH